MTTDFSFFLLIQTYKRLQKLLLTLSHKATISSVDRLGSNHDAAVHGWRTTLEQILSGVEVRNSLVVLYDAHVYAYKYFTSKFALIDLFRTGGFPRYFSDPFRKWECSRYLSDPFWT